MYEITAKCHRTGVYVALRLWAERQTLRIMDDLYHMGMVDHIIIDMQDINGVHGLLQTAH